jgi:DNA uptake protein ComE-like DNA-binding protein
MRHTAMRAQRGYVLIMVLGALALIAVVAARFAQRIEELQRQTATLQAHAQQRLEIGNALAATLYLASTRPLGPGGFGPGIEPVLHADGRLYRLPSGGEVQVQDQRGLIPLGAAERRPVSRLLQSLGVAQAQTDSWIDVLLDYQDTDSLKRLNGAEAPEYAALGLPPPRNEWLISLRELGRMPVWKERPDVVDRIEAFASVARQSVLNPNTASAEVLAAALPTATPEQLELLVTLRQRAPFVNGAAAQRATGLLLDRDEYVFHCGPLFRITVSAAGAPRALQYNVTLVPGGAQAPWLISEAHPVTHRTRDTPDRATPFPLAISEVSKP